MPTNNLPPNWSWVKLGNACKINPKFVSNGFNDEKEVSFLPMRAVEELTGRIDLTDERKYGKVKKGYTFFGEGDVIFAKITPCMENGKVAITTRLKNGIGFGSTEFHVLRPNSNLLNTFLFFYLIQSSYRRIAQRNMTGTAGQLRVPKRFIEESEIPLPPLPEQKKIVEKIEELFSQLDSGVASLKKAKEQIRLFCQSVLASAFSGRLHHDSQDLKINRIKTESGKFINPENPEILVNHGSDNLAYGWKWVKLFELTELITKGASPRWQGFEYVNDHTQTLFVTSENVRDNYLEISKPKFLQDEFNDKQKRSILKKGDVLFNIVGASIGRATVFNVDTKSNINQAVALIRLNEKLNNKYLSFYLNSDAAKKYYMNEVVDVARANLSLTDTSNIPIPYCPLFEQTQIVEEIEKRFSEADNLEKAINESLTKAETLRQSILKQAFEGKLV